MVESQISSWLTTMDTARRLGTSESYVRLLRDAGRLQAVRTRLGWLVDPVSVERLAAARAGRADVVVQGDA